jgi:hypothetical protein
MPKPPELFWYSNCRLGGKTATLLGPFVDEETALRLLDAVAPQVIQDRPECEHATFGAMSVTQHIGYGDYNYILQGSGIPILVDPHGPPPNYIN